MLIVLARSKWEGMGSAAAGRYVSRTELLQVPSNTFLACYGGGFDPFILALAREVFRRGIKGCGLLAAEIFLA